MEKDIDTIMAELDELRDQNRSVANTATSLTAYEESRNKYRDTIITSELKYGDKSPHLSHISGDDKTFFKRNWDKFLHAANIIDNLSSTHYAALLEIAKAQDAAMELKVISERMNSDGALGGEPYDNQIETIVGELERVIGERYEEIEKRYWNELFS